MPELEQSSASHNRELLFVCYCNKLCDVENIIYRSYIHTCSRHLQTSVVCTLSVSLMYYIRTHIHNLGFLIRFLACTKLGQFIFNCANLFSTISTRPSSSTF